MGAHHYHIELLPRTSAGVNPDDENVWELQPPESLLKELRVLLPNDTSWGGVEEYESGEEWGSDLRIWHQDEIDGPVVSIVLRYAPIEGTIALLERFLTLAADHDMLVYSSASQRAFEPKWDELVSDLKTTPAFQFLSDPGGALKVAAAKVQSSLK